MGGTDETTQTTDDSSEDTRARTEDDNTDDQADRTDKDASNSEEDVVEPTQSRPRNYVDLTGSLIGSAHTDRHKDKGRGRVKISGDVRLKGNILARGRVELNGGTVTYDCASPTRIVGRFGSSHGATGPSNRMRRDLARSIDPALQ